MKEEESWVRFFLWLENRAWQLTQGILAEGQTCYHYANALLLTNVAWQDQEVIVCQSAILLRVNQIINTQAIFALVFLLENLQGLGIIHWRLAHSEKRCSWASGITVQDRHFEWFKQETMAGERKYTASNEDFTNQSYVLCKIVSFSEKRKRRESTTKKIKISWPSLSDRAKSLVPRHLQGSIGVHWKELVRSVTCFFSEDHQDVSTIWLHRHEDCYWEKEIIFWGIAKLISLQFSLFVSIARRCIPQSARRSRYASLGPWVWTSNQPWYEIGVHPRSSCSWPRIPVKFSTALLVLKRKKIPFVGCSIHQAESPSLHHRASVMWRTSRWL